MAVELNHTIIWCRDKRHSSDFYARILGLPPPRPLPRFLAVELANGVSLDFMEREGEVAGQHYAFLVAEQEFDAVLERVRAEGLDHWADPERSRPGAINRNDGGRGFYFEDPDGHLLEAITRHYGSG